MASSIDLGFSGGPGGSSGSAPKHLFAGDGKDVVCKLLSSNPPKDAIRQIQKVASLQNPRCKPLLGLADQLGHSRVTTHTAVLDGAKEMLLQRIQSLPTEKLLELLDKCFPYMSVTELQPVPMAILQRLDAVPAHFLKPLAENKEIFGRLPLHVQRQVWELDKSILKAHFMPIVAAYTFEIATVYSVLDTDECLPESVFRRLNKAVPPRRSAKRKGSSNMKVLLKEIGNSWTVYKGIIDLCVAKFRESSSLYIGVKEAAYCSMRSQLLMAIHDSGADAAANVCNKDPVHKLAWNLDACFKDRGLNEKRLNDLKVNFSEYIRVDHRSGGQAQYRAKRDRNDFESSDLPGVSSTQPHGRFRVLGEMGMILRDPTAFNLIVSAILERIHLAAKDAKSIQDNDEIPFLTQLLQLAVDARNMLRNKLGEFPAPRQDLLQEFYPMIAAFMADSELRGFGEDVPGVEPGRHLRLVEMLVKNEIVRKVAQAFLLDRLADADIVTAHGVLTSLIQAMRQLKGEALVEWAPFAYTLTSRLVEMAKGVLPYSSPFFREAVEHILVKLVESDSEAVVHNAVLRCLVDAASSRTDPLPLPVLNTYLQATLENSRKSRRRYKKRKAEDLSNIGGYGSPGSSSGGQVGNSRWGRMHGSGSGSDAEDMQRGADGVRSAYLSFQSIPGVNESSVPALFQYLNAPQ